MKNKALSRKDWIKGSTGLIILGLIIVGILHYLSRWDGSTLKTKLAIPDFLKNTQLIFDVPNGDLHYEIGRHAYGKTPKKLGRRLKFYKPSRELYTINYRYESIPATTQFTVVSAIKEYQFLLVDRSVNKFLILKDPNGVESYVSYAETQNAYYYKDGQKNPIGNILVDQIYD